VGVEPATSRS